MKINKKNIYIIGIMIGLLLTISSLCIIITTINNIRRYNKYDLNNDGKVNSLDLLILQKYILEEN